MDRRRTHGAILLLVLAGHLAGVVGLIGVDAVAADRPVVHFDLGLHFYRAALLRESGGFPGLVWDPGYLAGYPVGGTTDVDNRLGELALVLLAFLPAGSAWNVALIVLYGVVPLLLWWGARWSGARPTSQLLAAVLGSLLFWAMTSRVHAFVNYGMYGWVVFSAALPLQVGALQGLLARPNVRSGLRLCLATTLAAYAHGLAVTYLLLLALIVLGRARQLRWAHLAVLAGSAAVTAAIVWPIARPVLATLEESGGSAGGLAVYFQAEFWKVLELVRAPDRVLANAVLILCAAGLATRQLDRPRAEQAGAALLIAAVTLFGFMLLPPSGFQPTRHLQPALFLAALPAASVLAALWQQLGVLARPARPAVAGLLLVLVLPIVVGWALTALGKNPLATGPSSEAAALVDHLRQSTSPRERILVEDDGDHFGGNHFGATHLVGYLAREIDRQLIGGPHPVTVVRGGSVTFVDGQLLGRAVAEYADAELAELLRSYNIGTIVVWSEGSRQRFASLGLEELGLAGGYFVFRTGLAPGFAEGAAAVAATARPNEIRVTGATSSPTLLRWQWDPRMATEPPLPLRRVESPYAPHGFILVSNGDTSDFVVRYRG